MLEQMSYPLEPDKAAEFLEPLKRVKGNVSGTCKTAFLVWLLEALAVIQPRWGNFLSIFLAQKCWAK